MDVTFFNPPRSASHHDHVLNTAMLWLASALKEQGMEAIIRMPSGADLEHEIVGYLEQDRPQFVAIACKWWNTLYGALRVAAVVRRHFPGIPVIMGGHTATVFARELVATGNVDIVLMGDVDHTLPLLVRENRVANGWTRTGYQKGPAVPKGGLDHVHLDRLEHLTDRPDWVPGYVWLGRGCSYDCFYCLERREEGKRFFDRNGPRLRPESAVAHDIAQMSQRGQIIFDYEHPSINQAEKTIAAIADALPDRHRNGYYFHWGLPSRKLLSLLSEAFNQVGICVDVQAFHEPHRKKLSEAGLIKPFFSDQALWDVMGHAQSLGNIHVDATGIVGMPWETEHDRERSLAWIEQTCQSFSCTRDWRFSPLHVIPGTALAQNGVYHNLEVVRRSFNDFLSFTQEAYETVIPYYATDRRHHPYGVYPQGQPQAIVHFMQEANLRLTSCRDQSRNVRIHQENNKIHLRLQDPYTPLATLRSALYSLQIDCDSGQELHLELGPGTWFHTQWADYTSESGENSAVNSSLGPFVAAIQQQMIDLIRPFSQVVLKPAPGRWGVLNGLLPILHDSANGVHDA